MTKIGAHVRPFSKAIENSDALQENRLGVSFFLVQISEITVEESISAILLKLYSTTEVFLHEFCMIAPFKISENFL